MRYAERVCGQCRWISGFLLSLGLLLYTGDHTRHVCSGALLAHLGEGSSCLDNNSFQEGKVARTLGDTRNRSNIITSESTHSYSNGGSWSGRSRRNGACWCGAQCRWTVRAQILICASVPQHAEHVGLTTTADGSSWAWVVVRLAAGNHVIPVASPAHVRVPPAGVPDHTVNWICVPPAAHVKWTCGLAEFPGLMEEARQIAARVVQDGLAPGHIAAGQPAAALPTLMYPVTSMGAGAGLLPVGGNAGVVAGGVANPGAAGALGFNAPEPQTTPDELARLMEGIKLEIGRAKGETDKKAKKKKKKDKSKKSKKKKRGSSSSSSGRSRSGSSSSSASEDFLRWRQEGKTKRVKPEELRRLEAQRFKARGELLTFPEAPARLFTDYIVKY